MPTARHVAVQSWQEALGHVFGAGTERHRHRRGRFRRQMQQQQQIAAGRLEAARSGQHGPAGRGVSFDNARTEMSAGVDIGTARAHGEVVLGARSKGREHRRARGKEATWGASRASSSLMAARHSMAGDGSMMGERAVRGVAREAALFIAN